MLQGTSCRKKTFFSNGNFPFFPSYYILLLLWIDGIFDFSNNEHGANIKRASNQSQTRRCIKVPDLNGEGKMSFYLFREKSTVTCSHESKNRLGPLCDSRIYTKKMHWKNPPYCYIAFICVKNQQPSEVESILCWYTLLSLSLLAW